MASSKTAERAQTDLESAGLNLPPDHGPPLATVPIQPKAHRPSGARSRARELLARQQPEPDFASIPALMPAQAKMTAAGEPAMDRAKLLEIARAHQVSFAEIATRANSAVVEAHAALAKQPATRSAEQVQAAMPVRLPKPKRKSFFCPMAPLCLAMGLPLKECVYR